MQKRSRRELWVGRTWSSFWVYMQAIWKRMICLIQLTLYQEWRGQVFLPTQAVKTQVSFWVKKRNHLKPGVWQRPHPTLVCWALLGLYGRQKEDTIRTNKIQWSRKSTNCVVKTSLSLWVWMNISLYDYCESWRHSGFVTVIGETDVKQIWQHTRHRPESGVRDPWFSSRCVHAKVNLVRSSLHFCLWLELVLQRSLLRRKFVLHDWWIVFKDRASYAKIQNIVMQFFVFIGRCLEWTDSVANCRLGKL